MSEYRDIITLNKNARGCYILDTIKGCSYVKTNPGGCYGDCYANNIATRYGFVFAKPIIRDFIRDRSQIYFDGFIDETHENEIIRQIKNADMPFIRIGEMGDPSENWDHTLSICKSVSRAGKKIVIITKHWQAMTEKNIEELERLDICINTSISAMDKNEHRKHRLGQYLKLSEHCNSVLRIVSCEFNTENKEGAKMANIQDTLFTQKKVIDTIFRPSYKNELVKAGIIRTEKKKFLKGEVLASVYNKNNYFGLCNDCPEQCGLTYA